MAKMRAYKLAEELGIDRHEFVEKAAEAGIDLKSAMTALEDMIAAPGPFGRLARRFSSNPGRVRRAYPWLRRLRRAALFAKGKPGFGR